MDLSPLAGLGLAPSPRTALPRPQADEARLRASAEAFEATFLAEMLKHASVNKTPETHGGGYGEDAFSSMLTEEYARLLTERGGIGLAEHIFEALKTRTPER